MAEHKDIPKKPVKVFDTKPLKMKMEAGKYFWCSCGRSRKHPYCDGSHHHTGIRPVRIVIENDEEVYWCACKHTGTPPWCDGTHHRIPEDLRGKLADGTEE